MFKHILFPTDNSEKAAEAFSVAVELARKFEGKITLLNIHEEFLNENEREALRVSVEDYKERMREHALSSKESMELLVRGEEAMDFCDVELREGVPRTEIIDAAEEFGADVIVMASNGRSNLAQVLLGSVAEHVVRHSKIPVFVIKVK